MWQRYAPVRFAFRRMRTQRFSVAGLVLALTAAGALIGWSTLTSALSQERNVRLQLRSAPSNYRSIYVRYYTLPLEADYRAAAVRRTFQSFADVTGPTTRVQVWHSIDPNDPDGVRLAVARETRRDVRVEHGRLPAGCHGRICEALVLAGRGRLGRRVPLGRGRFALIVGSGSLRTQVLPDRSELGPKALLVRSVSGTLAPLVAEDGSTVLYGASLDPDKVRGFALPGLSERLRQAITRLERGDSLVRATAPLATIDNLAERGRVARERLLLVAGQAAALVIAFAAFVASTRRRETELADFQLTTLGASRRQVWTARLVEAFVPAVVAVVLAIAGLLVAAFVIAEQRGLPLGFVHAALPLETVLAVLAAGLLGFGLLLASTAPPKRSRFGVGALELAAVTALAAVVWETSATGALDPDRVAGGGNLVILALPALGFFAAGVLLLRLLPTALRAGERIARHGPTSVRLALLGAARSPAQTAAATTFLAVALGSALFSLNYRATLERQARDQARFTAGATWRVIEGGRAAEPNVTPLTQLERLTGEHPTPVLRLDGDVVEAYPAASRLSIRVLAVPAAQLRLMLGWRRSFSSLSPSEIAERIRPRPVRLSGPRIATDADELRVWARSSTDYPRRVVLHLLLPGQSFAHVTLGVVWRQWRLLTLPLPRTVRGAELVGVEYAPTYVPIDFKYDPKGFVDLGRIEEHRAGIWSPLPSLASWTPTTSPDGTAGLLVTTPVHDAPIARSLRFDLNGTFRPLIHARLGLPLPQPGFENGPVPALAGGPVAAQAVDGLLTIDLPGKQVAARVVGTARLFPTITDHPSSFVVFDYDTLFAVMNADEPGLVSPSEAWFFNPQPRNFASVLSRPPFRLARVVGVDEVERALLDDPLAAGTRTMLGIAGLLAAALSLLGLVLAARSALVAERLQIAEYEALGVSRATLRRSAELRLVALASLGVAAGLVGGFVSVRLTGAFVAVTGTAKRPLPPIATVIAWPAAGLVVGAVALAGAAAAALVAMHALRESTARRLRA